MTLPSPFFRKILLLTTLLLGVATAVRADHLVGGELSYRFLGYVGNDTLNGDLRYELIVNMYRDCVESERSAWFDGAPPSLVPPSHSGPGSFIAPMHVTVFRGQAVHFATLEQNLDNYRPVDENLGNPCLETNADICQQVGRYIFEIQLERSNEDYTISYSRCCRNPLTNIRNATNVGSTYSITITAAAQARLSSSPVFNIDPPIAICLREKFQFDQGATDIDGDSLSYVLCEPVLGGGRDNPNDPTTPEYDNDLWPLIEEPPPYEPVDWRRPIYSKDKPLGTSSTLEVDPVTGLLSGEPAFPGTFVLGVCVQEWSRGPNPVMLSETKRELQLNVVPCASIVEADLLETEIDDEGNFFIRGCGLGPQTIINQSTERRAIQSYSWELDLPGGKFRGSNRDLRVPSVDEEGIYDGVMILNKNSFSATCRDTAYFKLGVFPDSYPDFEFEETGCDDEAISFKNLSTTDADQIDTYNWNFADNAIDSTSKDKDPFHHYLIPGTFPVNLEIVDNNKCKWEVTKSLNHYPSPRTILLEPGPGFGCKPYPKSFVNRSTPIDSTYIFRWEFGDGASSDQMSPSHLYPDNGVFDVYLSIESPEGCFVDTTFKRLIDVRDAPVANFDFVPDPPTTLNPIFTVRDRSEGAVSQRYYLRDQQGEMLTLSDADGWEWKLRDTARVFATQIVAHPSGCIDSITKSLNLEFDNVFHMPNAFTPNGDGLNDLFFPVGVFDGITDYELRIWNRWGELIFATNEVDVGWDGRHRGTDSPGGGYLWDAQYRNEGGERLRYKGGVTLVR